jgi:hypothetical protein
VAVEGTWLSVKSGQSGQGDGSVEFTAATNPDPVVRRGALVLNSQRAEITQAAGQCGITLAESSASFAPEGGTGRVDVRASSALCTWSAASDQPWIAIRSGADGRGNASVIFDVSPTTGPPRTGTISIGEQRFSIIQSEGCTYAVAPLSSAAPSEGRNGTVAITTAAPCPWTASSNVSWLSFARTSGTGPGPLGFSVAATSGPARTGTAVIAGQVFTVTQSPGCAYQVQPLAHSVAASGGTGSISVTAAPGCEWTASSDAPWITLRGATSGRGGGSVEFVVDPTAGPARTGLLTVAGQRVTVSQGQGCAFTITPTQESVPSNGGGGRVNVATTDGCGWTASSQAPSWISITSGTSGTGNGTVQYSVSATTGPARSGTMTIAGHTFTVNQGQGCSFTLNPTSANVPDAGGRTSFEVQSTPGCGWNASTAQPSWITIVAGTSGNGTGTVQLQIAANAGPSRTGTVSVADKTFTVTQGSGCSIVLSSTSASVPAGGGTGNVGVTAPPGCAWTATSNAPAWLSVTEGTSQTGSGNVGFTASANGGPARSGTLTIGGQTFTVSQGESCTFSIAPEQHSAEPGASSVTVTVTTGPGCTWTTATNAAWLAVTPGTPVNGPGQAQVTIAANGGSPRTGTATIANRTFTVNQAGGCAFTVAPESLTSPAMGGPARVEVTSGADCTWTARSELGWVTVSGDGNGKGTSAVDLSIAANNGPARSGVLTIAGRTVTVSQESGCTFAINPTMVPNVPAGGGTGNITVTAGPGCTWTAVSQVLWIVISPNTASGTGDGVVQGTVEPNNTGAARTGTVIIAGHTLTVTQQ